MTTTAPTTKPSWLTGPFGASAAAADLDTAANRSAGSCFVDAQASAAADDGEDTASAADLAHVQ